MYFLTQIYVINRTVQPCLIYRGAEWRVPSHIYHPDKHHISVVWQDLNPENPDSDKTSSVILHQTGLTPFVGQTVLTVSKYDLAIKTDKSV